MAKDSNVNAMKDMLVGNVTNDIEEMLLAVDDLQENTKNEYSVDDVESLAENIKSAGLLEPIIVRKSSDSSKYTVLSGHRRLKAIKKIITDKETGWETFQKVKCIVYDLRKVDLPICDDSKERYIILSANAEQRNKNDYDKMVEISRLNEIYKEISANTDKPLGKRRDFIAEQLKISASQVQRYNAILNNACDELLVCMKHDRIDFNVAIEVSKLEKNQQEEFLLYIEEHHPETRITKDKLTEYIKSLAEETSEEDCTKELRKEYTETERIEVQKLINKRLREANNKLNKPDSINPGKYKKAIKLLSKIDELSKEMEKLFEKNS